MAAFEVYKVLNRSKNLALASIAGLIIVAIVATFGNFAGAVAAGIISAGLAIFVFLDQRKIQYLQTEYKIGPQKGFNVK